jgi:hypothetical protein
LLDFLYETDSKVFAKSMKEADKIKAPRNFEEYILSTGLAKV